MSDDTKNEDDGISRAKFAELVYHHQNKYIDLADRKASLLLTAHLAYLGLFTNTMSRIWHVAPDLAKMLSIITGLAVIVTIVCSTKAVYPKTPETPQGLILWESVTKYTINEYRDEILGRSESKLEEEMIDEAYKLAEVANNKYPYVRRAMQLTGIVVLLSLATGVVFYFCQ